MVRFYLDNDLANEYRFRIQDKGHDALLRRRYGQKRATDDQQLLTTAQPERILVTHNVKDFVLIHHAWRLWPAALGVPWPDHPGILVVPQSTERSIARTVDDLDRLVRSGRRLANEMYQLTVTGGWLRER